MADIPHADGPFADNTAYGAVKATALEAARLALKGETGAWISAVSECKTRILNGRQEVTLRFLSSHGFNYVANVKLGKRYTAVGFPFGCAQVRFEDHVLRYTSWLISDRGAFTELHGGISS